MVLKSEKKAALKDFEMLRALVNFIRLPSGFFKTLLFFLVLEICALLIAGVFFALDHDVSPWKVYFVGLGLNFFTLVVFLIYDILDHFLEYFSIRNENWRRIGRGVGFRKEYEHNEVAILCIVCLFSWLSFLVYTWVFLIKLVEYKKKVPSVRVRNLTNRIENNRLSKDEMLEVLAEFEIIEKEENQKRWEQAGKEIADEKKSGKRLIDKPIQRSADPNMRFVSILLGVVVALHLVIVLMLSPSRGVPNEIIDLGKKLPSK